MKKTYINPQTSVTMLSSREHILDGSAKLTGFGEGNDVTYGGPSEGGMTSDVKRDDYNVWNDDWSN